MTDEMQTNAERDPQVSTTGITAGAGDSDEFKVEPDRDEDGNIREGQVSEESNLDPAEADTPISDDQSVAGSPSDESGVVDEGPTGPNSRGGSDRN